MLMSWQCIATGNANAFRRCVSQRSRWCWLRHPHAPTAFRKSGWGGSPGRQEASVYWEDKWDARGKRFKANEVSCAHRTEAFGTIFVVTNLDNGKKIECPVQDRGPFARGRVLDFSLGAARKIGCDGLCRVNVRRAGYE